MNLLSMITDNVTELLVKIMEFTQTRQKVLTRNIRNMFRPGFVPQDLAVEEFSQVMSAAIEEHIRSRRLLLCDSENVKFAAGGSLRIKPVVDEHARGLLAEDRDSFLECQVNKLMENSLNQRIAAALLKQRHDAASSFAQVD